MAEHFERIARPDAVVENNGAGSSRGINRNHLTLLLTVVGVLSAAAGAGVATWGRLYVWHGGEQQLTVDQSQLAKTEAGKSQRDAKVNAVIEEYNQNPASHPKLAAEVKKLHADLNYVPPADALSFYEALAFAVYADGLAKPALERRKITAETRTATATEQNQRQDTEKKNAETRSATVDANAKERLLQKNLDSLERSARGAANGGLPGSSIPGSIGVFPVVRGGLPGTIGPASKRPVALDAPLPSAKKSAARDDIDK
jgi:hypothetical protein